MMGKDFDIKTKRESVQLNFLGCAGIFSYRFKIYILHSYICRVEVLIGLLKDIRGRLQESLVAREKRVGQCNKQWEWRNLGGQ